MTFPNNTVAATLVCLSITACTHHPAEPFDAPQWFESWRQADSDQPLLFSEGTWDFADASTYMLEHHPDLQVAREQTEQAAAIAKKSGLLNDPKLSASLMHATKSTDKPWRSGVSLEFRLPLGDRLQCEKTLAALDYELAKESEALLGREQSAALLQVWADVVASRQKVQLWRTHTQRLEDMQTWFEKLAAQGEADPLTSQGLLLRIRQALQHQNDAQLELNKSHGKLALSMGLSRSRLSIQTLDWPELPTATLAQNPSSEAVMATPVAKLAATRYLRSEALLALEQAKRTPDLSIGPKFGTEEGTSFLGLALGFPLPLFNGNAANIQGALGERRIARKRFEADLMTYHLEWEDAYHTWRNTQNQTERIEESIKVLNNMMQQIRERMELGELEPLQYLDTIDLHVEIELSRIDNLLASYYALSELLCCAPNAQVNGIDGRPQPPGCECTDCLDVYKQKLEQWKKDKADTENEVQR